MANPSASWYSQGSTGIEKAIEAREDRALGLGIPRRVFIPQDPTVTKQYVIIDDAGASILEHRLSVNGDWKNWMTCAGDACDACAAGHRPSVVQILTSVSCTAYTNDAGITRQYEIEPFVANGDAWKRLSRKKTENGGLGGKLISAARMGEKSPACGDEFSVVRAADMDKLFPLVRLNGKLLTDLFKQASASADFAAKLKNVVDYEVDADGKPLNKVPKLNYYQLFQPLSLPEMKRLVASADLKTGKKGGVVTGAPSAPAATDIPF